MDSQVRSGKWNTTYPKNRNFVIYNFRPKGLGFGLFSISTLLNVFKIIKKVHFSLKKWPLKLGIVMKKTIFGSFVPIFFWSINISPNFMTELNVSRWVLSICPICFLNFWNFSNCFSRKPSFTNEWMDPSLYFWLIYVLFIGSCIEF